MFVPVIKHVINTSLQKENYLSDDCGWLPWLCGNHVTMTTITFKKKKKKKKNHTHSLRLVLPAPSCCRVSIVCLSVGVWFQVRSMLGTLWCHRTSLHGILMCAATHKDTHAMRRQTERRYEDQRERERAGRTSKHCRKACWETHKEGRGGAGRLIECLHWLCDIPECETETLDRQTAEARQLPSHSDHNNQPSWKQDAAVPLMSTRGPPSVKKSNFTAEISMSLCQKNRSTHLTAFKCLTWSILN